MADGFYGAITMVMLNFPSPSNLTPQDNSSRYYPVNAKTMYDLHLLFNANRKEAERMIPLDEHWTHQQEEGGSWLNSFYFCICNQLAIRKASSYLYHGMRVAECKQWSYYWFSDDSTGLHHLILGLVGEQAYSTSINTCFNYIQPFITFKDYFWHLLQFLQN